MKFGKKFQEFVYSLSTNDKYSEYDSTKSFNRINKPRTETETNLLSHNNGSTTFGTDHEEDSNFEKYKVDGVHEVRLAWRHIKNWVSKYSPDLNSSLQKACTDDDLSDFQKDLNIKLPNCVLEFYKLTDGQYSDDYDKVGGLFFGLKLMPLDDIMVMTEHWRKVAKKVTSEMSQLDTSGTLKQLPKLGNYRFSNSSIDLINVNDNPDASRISLQSVESDHKHKQTVSKYPSQKAIPPGCIHPIFAHPMWIPMITDDVGNCIGLDLAPPATGNGKWGQIILFGREFDTKFLVADNWGDFLLLFANDLEMGNWDISAPEKNNYGDLMIGNEGDLIYVDKETKKEMSYLTVLKKRCIAKWVESLDKDEMDSGVKKLVQDLKSNPDSILNIKNLNDNSIDEFINNNLNLVGGVIEPEMGEEPTEPKEPKALPEQPKTLPEEPKALPEIIQKLPKNLPAVPKASKSDNRQPSYSNSDVFAYSEGKTLEDVEL
ncbi:Cell wall assembly regulator [Yamadazyma tenuis]|uniref:Cell wall assembly and cell proliferation coordinating protein n=1 Tax=Candida tenuis (strain ATCC 10573 / BCRC 21748 / CBS 615 / JCM 9827 / NBRC 10315 / NRRL Y-1498 / VKM Y-70) TaxID=590646 RepID=G3B8T8_CANTC|nr:uncharacterized protein CANTEDRAFT_136363 [Yamadazyma tenuis ATCC 10573]XP_006688595.1 cell wall assembly and cell proliferation coordinating protein [Yamadazyma tenuis ATCC 10573]EGV62424.1 hypothetical protein CANTEDRAFT_136363 [Yamadazyma tenuis ATCC 10573]EGV62425.1 cell wall assembly and cell proliferation coordinating protein [Yamadazyma tenuis ATCC 10573]WEJ93708.1 Cell wall assembly regulator [Yamadazyma tenuis]